MNNPDGVYNGLNILTYWGGLNLSRGNIRLTKDSSFLAFFKAVKGVKPHLLVGLHQDLSKEGDYIAYSEKSVADEIKRLMPPSWGRNGVDVLNITESPRRPSVQPLSLQRRAWNIIRSKTLGPSA